MTEKYIGKPVKEEMLCAARDLVSNETSRAVVLFFSGHTKADVAKAFGRNMKVTIDMDVAENLAECRLVNTQPTIVRRTARVSKQMLKSEHLGVNSRKCLEYLRERALEHGW